MNLWAIAIPAKGDVSLQDIVTFLTAFPDVRFIAAHWGGGLPFITASCRRYSVSLPTCGMILLQPPISTGYDFPAVAQIVGAERILFASDYGLLRQQRVIQHIRQADLDTLSVELILGQNAQRLLHL